MKSSVRAAGLILTLALVIEIFRDHQAPAATFFLPATDTGFVTEVGGSAKGDGTISPATYNYSVGREVHYTLGDISPPPYTPMDKRNYFVFDWPVLPGPIVSAVLHVYAGTFTSPDPIEAFGFATTGDYAGALADIDALAFANTVGFTEFDDPGDPMIGVAAALYDKLADGPGPLASYLITPANDDTIIDVFFTPMGLGFLNSYPGARLVLGGLVPTAMPPAFPQEVFGFTGPDIPGGDPLTPVLEITVVPEPSSCVPAAMGLVAIGVISRRARRK